jgi:hypothetical protein
METLKKGSSGKEVVKVQSQLIKLGWLVGSADGMFGPITEKAVIDFQKKNGLVVDGKVGPITYGALFAGSIPIEQGPAEGFPKIPSSTAEAKKIFGATQSVVESQLAFCEVPDALTCFPKKNGKRGFTCHRLMVPVFGAFFRDVVAEGLASKIYSYDGCFNWRQISGSSNLSNHSFGIAIDINYEGNELGDSTPAMDLRVVAIANRYNLFWGGNYRGRKDGMHFEYYRYS